MRISAARTRRQHSRDSEKGNHAAAAIKVRISVPPSAGPLQSWCSSESIEPAPQRPRAMPAVAEGSRLIGDTGGGSVEAQLDELRGWVRWSKRSIL